MEVALLRESLASERAQVAFLRGVVEGLQQSEATTKAALREALKLAPKQLSAGTPTPIQTESSSPNDEASESEINELIRRIYTTAREENL